MPRIAVDDVWLHVEAHGAGRPLLLLHGFTGSAQTWRPFVGAWDGARTIAVDFLGHGRSDSPEEAPRYTMDRTVADLTTVLDRLSVPSAVVLGYSLGGRVALRLALSAPERVGALILESTSAGIETEGARRARIAADEALATRIEQEGMEAFVRHWESLPLWASQRQLTATAAQALRRQRLGNAPRGLANSLRGLGAGRQESLWAKLGRIDVPTLLLAGELDGGYRAIAARMAEALPQSRLEVVPGAGHAVHLEQPLQFRERVGHFLASLPPESPAAARAGQGGAPGYTSAP